MPKLDDKSFFKIGEVARLVGVKTHVLRYWESEFASIRPKKTPSNQRLYRREDVEHVLLIKQLLYQEGFTVAGAKNRLRELQRKPNEGANDAAVRVLIDTLRADMRELLAIVDE